MTNILRSPDAADAVAGWNTQAEQIKAGTFVEVPHDVPTGGPSTGTLAPTGGPDTGTPAPVGRH